MVRLRLALLGGFQVVTNGRVITHFESDKGRALLAYLAVNQERPYRREALAALLWPDAMVQDGRNNLRQALFKLKQSLGEAAEPYFITTRTTIQFNRLPTDWLDIEAIRHADARELLQLYTGQFLDQLHLPDCQEFEEWVLTQREWHHQQAMHKFHQRTEEAMEAGTYDLASQLALRQISLDRWREEAHCQLMQALAQQGKFSAALAQYESCRAILADELGVEPTQETTRLYQQILTSHQSESTTATPQQTESSLTQPQLHLPTASTPFIGRQAELAQIAERLLNPECRLLTLIGSGGIGKTRLALQTAVSLQTQFPDGVGFVSLVDVEAQPQLNDLIATATAKALNLTFAGKESPQTQLGNYLQQKNILLIFDNFEQIMEASALVHDILGTAPDIKILVTSRQKLNLPQEWLLPIHGMDIPPMSVPARNGSIAQYDALKLFFQRARMIQPNFPLSVTDEPFINHICHLTQGTPLAIELAAAWVQTLSCAEIVTEMKQGLTILSTSSAHVPARHRSMQAVFAQSWARLSPAEQNTLMRLSLFRGGFQREAAAAVADASLPILQSLVHKSLIYREDRYRMHRLLRQFAAEQLTSSAQQETAVTSYLTYYQSFLQKYGQMITGQGRDTAVAALATEEDNIRHAWQLACQRENTSFLETAVIAVYEYYNVQSLFMQGEQLLQQAVQVWANSEESMGNGRIMARWAALHYRLGQYTKAQKQLETALQQATTDNNQNESAFCQLHLGILQHLQGQDEPAQTYLENSLTISRKQEDPYAIARAANALSVIYARRGQGPKAIALGHESIALYQAIAATDGYCIALGNLCTTNFTLGNYEEAYQLGKQSLAIARTQNMGYGIMSMTVNLGLVLNALGKMDEACQLYEEGLVTARELGHRYGEAALLNNLACIKYDMEEYEAARDGFLQTIQLRQTLNDQWGIATSSIHLGDVYTAMGAYEQAYTNIVHGLQIARQLDVKPALLEGLTAMATLWSKQARPLEAWRLVTFILAQDETRSDTKKNAQKLQQTLAQSLPNTQIAEETETAVSQSLTDILNQLLPNAQDDSHIE